MKINDDENIIDIENKDVEIIAGKIFYYISNLEKKQTNIFNKNYTELSKTVIIERKDLTNKVSKKDYDLMKIDDLIRYDKRSIYQYYWDCLQQKHEVLYSFFYKTTLINYFIRITLFFTVISMLFAFNALFYSDSFISERNRTLEISILVLLFF